MLRTKDPVSDGNFTLTTLILPSKVYKSVKDSLITLPQQVTREDFLSYLPLSYMPRPLFHPGKPHIPHRDISKVRWKYSSNRRQRTIKLF